MELPCARVSKVISGFLLMLLLAAGPFPARADYPTKVLDDMPVGYWRLNERLESTADNLGTGGPELDGSYVGGERGVSGPSVLSDGQLVQGMGPTNLAFEAGGENAYVGVSASPLSGLTEFSLTGWFNVRGFDQSRVGLFGQNDAVEFGFIEPNQLQLWTAGGGSVSWTFDPASDIPNGQWFYIAAVGTGQDLQLYLNGDMVQSGGSPITTDYGSSDFPFQMAGGGIFDDTGNQFRGTIDEVAIWDKALTGEQISAHFAAALGGGILGDFDGNGLIEVADVNLLERAIYEGSTDLLYDVDGNLVIDDDDLAFWVGDIAITWPGDANLDHEFNSTDLVQVLGAGQYEDGLFENSTWDTGDWNADLEFDSADFVNVLSFGGYEVGPPAAVAVPEPTRLSWIAGVLGLLTRIQRRRRGE